MNNPHYQHKSLAAGRWNNLSLVEQMANIGSEVARTISWRSNQSYGDPETAFYRALELLSFTKDDPKHTESTLREICRTYECLVDWFYGSKEYHSTDDQWQKYFMAFTYAARIGH